MSPNTAYGTKKLDWEERIVAKVLPMYGAEELDAPDDVHRKETHLVIIPPIMTLTSGGRDESLPL